MRFTSCSLLIATSLMLALPMAKAAPGPLPTLAPVARSNNIEIEPRHHFRRDITVVRPITPSSSAASPLITNGGKCSAGTQCSSGYCKSAICTEANKPSSGCTSNNQCTTGACNQGACVHKAGQAKTGSYCNDSTQCVSTAYCGTASNSCTTKKTTGTKCVSGTACSSGLCMGECIKPGTVKANSACSVDEMCENGLFCSANSQVCMNQYATGKKCTRSAMCNSGNCAYATTKSKTKTCVK